MITPTKLFIDCEWNKSTDELISMALIPEGISSFLYFYMILEFTNPTPWVQENVIPHIKDRFPHTYDVMQERLQEYLQQFEAVHIIANWPQDIEVFCKALISDSGRRLDTPPLTMEIVKLNCVSTHPNDAYFDAHALREAWLIERNDIAYTKRAEVHKSYTEAQFKNAIGAANGYPGRDGYSTGD